MKKNTWPLLLAAGLSLSATANANTELNSSDSQAVTSWQNSWTSATGGTETFNYPFYSAANGWNSHQVQNNTRNQTSTKALPENGKKYYFYNKHMKGNQYFYDKDGNVGFGNVKEIGNMKYVWTCEKLSNGNYTFKNVATHQYFAWKDVSATACEWALKTDKEGEARVTNEGSVSMKAVNQSGSSYMVCKYGSFDQARNGGFYDETYSSDFNFEECNDKPGMPVVGQNYYFYNKHKGGDCYFYDNNGAAGFSTTLSNTKEYVWTCETGSNGKLRFKNLATGKYFAWQSLSTTAADWTVDNTVGNNLVVNAGSVTMKMDSRNKYLVITKNNNYSFNQADRAGYYDAQHSSDFNFTICTTNWEAAQPTDFIGSSYGEKWVRLHWNNNTNHAAGLTISSTADYNNTVSHSNPVDMTADDQLWTLVGDAEKGFYLQNRKAGENYALKVDNHNNGTPAKLVAKKSANLWKLVEKATDVFAITPAENTGMSLNSYGGALNDLKLYNADDNGSKWKPMCVAEGFTMSTEVRGDNPYAENNLMAGELKFTINGGMTITSRIDKSVAAATYYLPAKAKVLLEQAKAFRGFKKGGFEVDGTKQETVELTVGENKKTLVNVFEVAPETGQYLYRTPGPTGKPYRIPAIATAKNGDIFAISDYRPCGSDIGYGEVDIKCRISKDNGATWGEEFFIANGIGDNNNGEVWKTGFGDAAVVADAERNELLIMMVCGKTVCWNGNYIPESPQSNPNRVAQVRGHFDKTQNKWIFTDPVEVTETIYPLFVKDGKATVQSLFIGSGRICQSRVTKVGDYYRLYCAVWTKNQGNRVIYSDDFGKSWHILGTVDDRPATGGDEPKCEEMPDGSVILSSRTSGRVFNIFTYTDKETGKGTWKGAVTSNGSNNGVAVGNSTNGEIMLFDAIRKSDNQKVTVAVQSVPFGNGRKNVGVFYKEINADVYNDVNALASNWTKGLQVSHEESAYSTMTLQKDNKIGFLFEETPGGYCIVYLPLTLEQMTNNAYSLDVEKYNSFAVTTKDAPNLSCALASFSATVATTTAQEGVKAYYVSSTKEQTALMTEIAPVNGKLVIPANTGVILQTAQPMQFALSPCPENSNVLNGENLLKHSAEEAFRIPTSENAYVLSAKGNVASFYKLSANPEKRTIGANRAYLVLSADSKNTVLNLSFGEQTGIGETMLQSEEAAGTIYDLSGRRVSHKVQRGIYIRNGKKVMIK